MINENAFTFLLKRKEGKYHNATYITICEDKLLQYGENPDTSFNVFPWKGGIDLKRRAPLYLYTDVPSNFLPLLHCHNIGCRMA